MDEVFLLMIWLHGICGDGADGTACTTQQLLDQMRADQSFLEEQRHRWEHVWKTDCREQTVALIQILLLGARYLSDLVDGGIPLLAPREVVEASAGVARPGHAEALLMGQAIHRAIERQIRDQADGISSSVVAEFQRLLEGKRSDVVPAASQHLDTRGIAARLRISEVTVARLCRSGLIDADKTAGNQWRTTEGRLQRSPYLNRTKRRAAGNGELE